jgi:hypothetical protein
MTILPPVCLDCKHFNLEHFNCLAFPNGIPDEITLDGNKHETPLKGQKSNIVFEPKND